MVDQSEQHDIRNNFVTVHLACVQELGLCFAGGDVVGYFGYEQFPAVHTLANTENLA